MSRDNHSTFAVEQAKAVHWQDLAEMAKHIRRDLARRAKLKELPEGTVMGIPITPIQLPVHISESFLAQNLLLHLKVEFPELPWDELQGADVPRESLAALQLVAARRTFRGTCEICAEWEEKEDAPVPTTIETQEAVRQFLKAKGQDIAEASLATYANILTTFSHKFPYLPTTPEPIRDYLAKRPSFKSRRLIYSTLNGMYQVAHDMLGAPQIMELISRPPKGKRKESDYVNLEQRRALEDAIRTDRDRALLYLYNDQGFRRSEATRVNVEDIFEDKIRVHGKEREEWMPLLPEVREVLFKLAEGRSGNEPVFISQRKKRLGPDMAAEIIGRLFKRAKVNGVQSSPHTLRHSFATLMQAAGCDRYSVELLMRHRTENTTDIYTHMSAEQRLQLLKPKLERYAPIRLLNGSKPNIPINSGLARYL